VLSPAPPGAPPMPVSSSLDSMNNGRNMDIPPIGIPFSSLDAVPGPLISDSSVDTDPSADVGPSADAGFDGVVVAPPETLEFVPSTSVADFDLPSSVYC
jgi:hypothetical protein